MTELVSIHEKTEDIDVEFRRANKNLSKHNSALLKKFYDKHFKKEGLSKARAMKTLITLRKFAEFTDKPLDKITEKQIEAYNLKLANDKKSQFTIMDFRKIMKCWLRFSGEKQNLGLIKSKELKCKSPYSNGNVLLPSDLPTDDEVVEIFKLASPRLKALLALCEGAGFRVSEAGTMRLKDLKWHEDGSVHATARQSKTKQKTVLIRADLAYYLKMWANSLPKNADNNLLFANPKNPEQPIQYATFRKELRKIGRELGLLEKRKISFHAFRHRHASWCISHMNSTMAKLRIWNNKTTRMDGIYGTFSNEQVDNDYLKSEGYIKKEEKPKEQKTRLCFKCKQVFPKEVIVCPDCSTPLTPEGLKEYENAKLKEAILDSFCELLGQEKVNELFSQIAKKIQASGIDIKKIQI